MFMKDGVNAKPSIATTASGNLSVIRRALWCNLT